MITGERLWHARDIPGSSRYIGPQKAIEMHKLENLMTTEEDGVIREISKQGKLYTNHNEMVKVLTNKEYKWFENTEETVRNFVNKAQLSYGGRIEQLYQQDNKEQKLLVYLFSQLKKAAAIRMTATIEQQQEQPHLQELEDKIKDLIKDRLSLTFPEEFNEHKYTSLRIKDKNDHTLFDSEWFYPRGSSRCR